MAIKPFTKWKQENATGTATPAVSSQPVKEGGLQSFSSWKQGTPVQGKPDVKEIVDTMPVQETKKKSLIPRISDTISDLSASFVTGMGQSAGRILDQAFHLATKAVQLKEEKVKDIAGFAQKALPYVGIEAPKQLESIKNIKLAERLEKKRLQFKENVGLGADVAREVNPISGTFAGKTAEVIGGMVPQVSLALAKVPQVALAFSESLMNAEDSYDENIKNGMDQSTAFKRAVPQLGADLLATYVTNKFGALGKLQGGTNSIFKSLIPELLKDASLEVAQEVWQQGLQNMATNKPFTNGMTETAKLTIIPALLFGGAGSIAAHVGTRESLKENTSNKVEEINQKFEEGKPLNEKETIVHDITGGEDPFLNTKPEPTEQEIAQVASQIVTQKEMLPQVKESKSLEIKKPEIRTTPEIVPKKKETIEVPRSQLPVGEGKKGISKLEARIKNISEQITPQEAEAMGISTYEKGQDIQQLTKARDYVLKNPEEALEVALGNKSVPEGMLKNAVSIALMEQVESGKNSELASKLASLESTRFGQEIEILKRVNPENVVVKGQELFEIRKQKAEKQLKQKGSSVQKEKTKAKKEFQSEMKKRQISIADAQSLLESLVC